ncbi:hypothetical protein PEC18_04175 [Paucibacter sp. O1-1]|nr:hypothetical protein [Paucibacter sp. O1-1]MDA3825070.1 hypothetical protein [Paucibacter sp. O1-1]
MASSARCRLTQYAQAGDTHAVPTGRHRGQFLPGRAAMTLQIGTHVALPMNHRPGDVRIHAGGHVGINNAVDRHVWKGRVARDVIRACADRLDQAQPRHAGQQANRRQPADHGIDVLEAVQLLDFGVNAPERGVGKLSQECR